MGRMAARAIHHLDLWVDDYATAGDEWAWLLGHLDWESDLSWESGRSWAHPDGTYLFMETSDDQQGEHDRMRAGLNHIAFIVESRDLLDRMRAESSGHGWRELFSERYPHAGGEQHTALYLESSEGFEVELVVEP